MQCTNMYKVWNLEGDINVSSAPCVLGALSLPSPENDVNGTILLFLI